MDNKIDFHIHTTASDGQMSPWEIVRHAHEEGLTHIALTDHDSVSGLISLEKKDLSPFKNLTIIPGIEFSTDLPEHEVHILGYWISVHNAQLHRQLKILNNDRRDRAKKMVHKLAKLGYDIEYDEVLNIAGNTNSVGRPHIAKALIEKKYFHSVTDAFEKLLYKNGPAYVPHYKLAPHLVIKLIKDCGGIPVLAHPGLIGDDNIVFDLLKLGIRGLEVYHPAHSNSQTNDYLSLAKNEHLLITGGSDFHATPSRYPEKLGIFPVPYYILSDLLAAGQA